MPTAGGRPRRLLDAATGVSWDPDSRVIVSERDGRLMRIGPHVERARPIIDIGSDCGSSFAPDGRLAIVECGLLGTLDRELSADSQRDLASGAINALWGRGGLAYTWSSVGGSGKSDVPGRDELRLIPPGGRRITLLAGNAVPIAWSADGGRLLVETDDSASIITLSPRSVMPVSPNGQANDLSADGHAVLVSRPDGLHVISDTGRDRLIAAGASAGAYIA